MPAVSIITPAWNAARFLPETVASVQAQTFGDWEMLIADDSSSDNTRAIIAEFAETDSRIKLLALEKNGGPARARQAALDIASGRYLAFLDSDDLWLPNKLERQLTFMAETSAALCYSSFRRISENGSEVGRVMPVPKSLTYAQLLRNTAIATLTVVIDREIVGDVEMTDEGYDDFCLWLSVLRRGHTAYGIQEDLARYRVVGGSVSSEPIRSALWVWTIYRDVEKLRLTTAAWCLANFGMRAYIKRLWF